MARVNRPTPERIRVLLTDPKATPADLDRTGDLFLADGRPCVAAMFFERTRTPDRVRMVRDLALREGDAFLLDWTARVLPESAAAEDWKRCAEAAERLGKFSFARTAWVRAGDPERAAAVKG